MLRLLCSAPVCVRGPLLAQAAQSQSCLCSSATPGKVRVRIRGAAGGPLQESAYACGATLMDSVRDDPTTTADMQGSCNGTLECSTCHVHLEGGWFERLQAASPASEREEDVLDRALEVRVNSRLACQITLTTAMDGLEVAMPAAARDARFQQFLDRYTNGK